MIRSPFLSLGLGRPLLAGDSDIDQLSKIFAALGTPTEEQWPVRLPFCLLCFVRFVSSPLCTRSGHDAIAGLRQVRTHTRATTEVLRQHHYGIAHPSLFFFHSSPPLIRRAIRSLFSAAGEDAMDLLFKMLKFDPVQRISATDVRPPPALRPSSSPPANVLSLSPSPGTRSSLLHQRPGTHRTQEPPPAPKEGGVAQAPPEERPEKKRVDVSDLSTGGPTRQAVNLGLFLRQTSIIGFDFLWSICRCSF